MKGSTTGAAVAKRAMSYAVDPDGYYGPAAIHYTHSLHPLYSLTIHSLYTIQVLRPLLRLSPAQYHGLRTGGKW
jgi:hypothetical protein